MKISLLWTELFNFPKRGANLAKNTQIKCNDFEMEAFSLTLNISNSS